MAAKSHTPPYRPCIIGAHGRLPNRGKSLTQGTQNGRRSTTFPYLPPIQQRRLSWLAAAGFCASRRHHRQDMNKSGWPSAVKPSQTVVKDEKKPQRRTPWACDECRLRKRKCDGVEPCSPCQRSGLECSYHFRRPAPPQTQRIQMLEVHLRYVRSFLRDASHKVSPEMRVDFENVLHKISTVAPDVPSPPNGIEPGHALSFDDGASSAYLGEAAKCSSDGHPGISQQSFLQQVVQLTTGQADNWNDPSPTAALFSLSLPEKQHLSPAPLPSRRKAMLLIDALFDSQLPVLAFLHERYFRDMVDMVYENDSPDDGVKAFRPLLHFALALGRLFVQADHGADGCQEVDDEAIEQYLAGQDLLQPLAVSNLTALQTVLCAAVFLMSTCRVTTAHPLIGLACSIALRLGLHAKNTNLAAEEQLFRARACAAVLHLDLLASFVLGIPSFIQPQEIDLAVFDHLTSESYQHQDWQTVAVVAQLKLLFVSKANEDAAFSAEAIEDPLAQQTAIKHAGTRLKGWRDHVATLLQDLQNQAGGSDFRYELEMLYNFGFLMLWRPLLLDLLSRAKSNGRSEIVPDDVQFALACIKLAESCRARSEEMLQERRINPFSWTVVYTNFLSDLYVIALLSVERLATQLEDAWLPVLGGVRILAVSRCGTACATPALELLKVIARSLPVGSSQIDLEAIATSTRRLCDTKRTESDGNSYVVQRNDDILNLLNTRSHEANSTSPMSRSPSSL